MPPKKPAEPKPADDLPEWTDDQFDRAKHSVAGKVVREARGTLTKPDTSERARQLTMGQTKEQNDG